MIMKIFSKTYLFGLLAAAVSFTACDSEDDYVPGGAENTNPNAVVFPYEAGSEKAINFDATEWTFTAVRAEEGDAVEIPIIVLENTSEYLEVPASIKFEAGKKEAQVTIGLKEDMPYNTECRLDITVPEQYRQYYTTDASSHYMGVVLTKNTFAQMPGKARYREDCLTTFFPVENVVYEVDIEYDVITPGLYRLVNPYGEAYPYNEPGDYDAEGKYYMEIDATDPDFVYVVGGDMGFDWSYGMFNITSYVHYYMMRGNSLNAVKNALPELFGTLKDGLITMPEKSMLISMSNFNGGGYYEANTSGMFAVQLPDMNEVAGK